MSSVTPQGRVMSMESHGGQDGANMYDALRDLFLGHDEPVQQQATSGRTLEPGASADGPSEVETSDSPLIEALVLGHLPVQQSPWVMQYAKDAAARRGGAVALLRIREGEATIDLVGGTVFATTPSTLDIREAFRSIASKVRGVIVRVDPTSEPLLPGIGCVDALTLLTGADEAAIVGSYRTVKGLIGDATDAVPPLRLAIMGSTTEKALAAADKIQKAVEANLRERIEITACLARIGIGRSSLIYRGLMMEDLAGLLSDFRGMLESPDTPDRTEGAGGVHPVAAAASPTVEIPVSSRLGHAAPHASHAIPTQSTTTSGVRASVPAFGAAGAGPGAGAVVEVPASGPLASHVAGLATVALGCPAYPLVEFALDGAGGLHLLALADSHEGSWKTAGSLLAAGQWAKAHAALIALAAQATGQKVDAASTPVLHLFTPVAKGAGTFADAGVRPHLLVQVKVEGRAGWYSTELA